VTWLPISLKNAAKCDKWYQLQNHSITESLNAKGAWEKLFTSHPRACRISVSNNKKEALFVWEHLGNSASLQKILLESLASGWTYPNEPRWCYALLSPSRGASCLQYTHNPLSKTKSEREKNQPVFLLSNFSSFNTEFCLQTWVRQDYPPNLSILLSGGKENNRDSLSQRRAKRDRTRCRIGSQRPWVVAITLFCDWCGTGKIQAQSIPIAEYNPSCEYWAKEGVSPLSHKPKHLTWVVPRE